jgi:hypothetical protein
MYKRETNISKEQEIYLIFNKVLHIKILCIVNLLTLEWCGLHCQELNSQGLTYKDSCVYVPDFGNLNSTT